MCPYYCYCYFGQGQYELAAYHFKNFTENYYNSKHMEECAFMYTKCLYKDALPYFLDQTNTEKAISEVQAFLNIYSNSKFNLFEFEEALQLYKLIYKDLETFQKQFLQKLEFIPNLENLCLQLGSNFERATPLSLERIREVNDITIDYLADYYAEIVNNDESKSGKSFYNNLVNKLKEVFLMNKIKGIIRIGITKTLSQLNFFARIPFNFKGR